MTQIGSHYINKLSEDISEDKLNQKAKSRAPFSPSPLTTGAEVNRRNTETRIEDSPDFDETDTSAIVEKVSKSISVLNRTRESLSTWLLPVLTVLVGCWTEL